MMAQNNNPAVFFCKDEITEILPERLNEIKQAAQEAPLGRARICLHHDNTDNIHEMIIAFCKDSYIRPHKHIDKSESFHVIEGELLVAFFDETGEVTHKIKMGPYGSSHTFVYRLSSSLWHMVIPLSEFVVIHETTAGPFMKEEVIFPEWAPEDSDIKGIKILLDRIAKERE